VLFQQSRSLARLLCGVVAGSVISGCLSETVVGPVRQPPYLAVLMQVDAAPGIAAGGPYRFRVRELSGTIKFDTSFRASPRDTVIIPVTAATYRVDISDVPSTCGVRDGTSQAVVVPPRTNTSVLRFTLSCVPSLMVAAYVDGFTADSDFVVTVKDSIGRELAQVLPANDTVTFDRLPAGTYSVNLRHLADNCTVLSDGGPTVPVTLRSTGGTFLPFRVTCADAARRPRIVSLVGTLSDGSLGYLIRAVDPDKDIERIFTDITDCKRRSVLAGGGRRRGPFGGQPNVTGRDTAVIVGAYDLEPADSASLRHCLAAWVADARGNTSSFVEVPLRRSDPARQPVLAAFEAKRNGTKSVLVDFQVQDPDNDFLGLFAVYLVRDGVLAAADGQPDRVVLQPAGTIARVLPEFLVNIGIGNWNDYLAVIVYGFDRAGNMVRVQRALPDF
jgi:hypothetical protein